MTININNRSERLLFILTLGALTMLGPMAIDLYLPALPAIADDMGEPLSRIQLTLSAYTIGFALGQLLYGPLSDRFGRQKVLLPGLIGYILTNILAAMCTDANQLIAVRVLQAMAGAAVMVTIPAMVRDLFPRQESAKVLSSVLLVMTVAPLLAPVLGGQILRFWGWESLFLLLAALAFLAMGLALWRVPETLPEDHRLVVPPAQLAATYLRVLKNRNAMGCILCHGFFFGGMFAFIAGSPFVYIELFGISPENYGLVFGLNIVGMGIMNMVNIRIVGRLPLFSILRMGSLSACVAAFALLLNAHTGNAGLAGIVIPVVVYVSCIALTGPNSNALALSHFPRSAGTANAMAGAVRFSIGAGTTALVGVLHDETAAPMAMVMAGCGVMSVLSMLLVQNEGIPATDLEQQKVTAADAEKVSA